ncbi:flagellar hook-basal body complex protein FliE [Phenylobacterium sp.]|uniref:flagellar hook-basal body complex protein FliE n=1 Tax=Phenylobacterium sp. TaxID=1871053 RepID=UPI0035AE1C2B
MVSPLAAAKAYAAAQSQGLSSLGGGKAAEAGGFGDMVKSAMNEVMSTTKHAETQIAQQVAGKADLVDVVTAISAAETSLETVMAVRDQVISAYQEIMRMPI